MTANSIPETLWQQVKKIKAADARKIIPRECFDKHTGRAIFWYLFDLSIFLMGLSLVFFSQWLPLQIAGSLIAGIATAMLFVWAHDAAHGALFKNAKWAEVLGTIAMLPSLNMYRMWSYGHNKVHHGFTSFSPIDWIWRPLTVQQYCELSKFQRLLYRLERNFFTCAFHYFRRIWWDEMLRFNPGKDAKQRRYFRMGKCFSLFYAVSMATIAYQYAGGLWGVLFAVIIPFVVFNYFIAMIVYLHHTHPKIPFFDQKREWSLAVGALYCSTIIHCSNMWKMLLHNIMTHIPHHLDIRIPFYHLPKAYQALRKEYGEYFHEYRFKWRAVLSIFNQCKLYDFENHVWMSFKEARQALNRTKAAA